MTTLRALYDELHAMFGQGKDREPADPPPQGASPMLGRWDPWYRGGTGKRLAACYGPSDTYVAAEAWLKGLAVEDWGCGYAQFREFHEGPYRGVDGSAGWADVVADLTVYRSSPTARPEGILLRHVLEHNRDWRRILMNAVTSFDKRMVLIVFTPDSGTRKEKVLAHVDAVDVDDLSLPFAEIEAFFGDCKVLDRQHYPTATGYQGETLWRVEK